MKNEIVIETGLVTISSLLSINNPALSTITTAMLPLTKWLFCWAHNEKDIYSERQKINIANILIGAEKIKTKTKNTSENLDEDWIIRYINIIKDIKKADLQALWSKILLGEIEKPGSVPLRTLNIISNITYEEALLFRKLSEYMFINGDNYYLPKLMGNTKYSIEFKDIIKLREASLILTEENTSGKTTINPNKAANLYNHDYSICVKNITNDQITLKFQHFMVSSTGNQILNLFNRQYNYDFVFAFAKQIENDYKNDVYITIRKINELRKNDIILGKTLYCSSERES